MEKKTASLTEEEWNTIIKGLHNLYLRYGGYYEDDEVYEFNSELDEVIQHIKGQINEKSIN